MSDFLVSELALEILQKATEIVSQDMIELFSQPFEYRQ